MSFRGNGNEEGRFPFPSSPSVPCLVLMNLGEPVPRDFIYNRAYILDPG